MANNTWIRFKKNKLLPSTLGTSTESSSKVQTEMSQTNETSKEKKKTGARRFSKWCFWRKIKVQCPAFIKRWFTANSEQNHADIRKRSSDSPKETRQSSETSKEKKKTGARRFSKWCFWRKIKVQCPAFIKRWFTANSEQNHADIRKRSSDSPEMKKTAVRRFLQWCFWRVRSFIPNKEDRPNPNLSEKNTKSQTSAQSEDNINVLSPTLSEKNTKSQTSAQSEDNINVLSPTPSEENTKSQTSIQSEDNINVLIPTLSEENTKSQTSTQSEDNINVLSPTLSEKNTKSQTSTQSEDSINVLIPTLSEDKQLLCGKFDRSTNTYGTNTKSLTSKLSGKNTKSLAPNHSGAKTKSLIRNTYSTNTKSLAPNPYGINTRSLTPNPFGTNTKSLIRYPSGTNTKSLALNPYGTATTKLIPNLSQTNSDSLILTSSERNTSNSRSFEETMNSTNLLTGGLPNLGRTCYVNSSLQFLFTAESFCRELSYMLNNSAHSQQDPFLRCFVELSRLRNNSQLRCNISKDDLLLYLIDSAGETNPEFTIDQQNDAHEFLLYCLDRMEQSKTWLGWQEAVNPVRSYFDFKMKNIITCLRCKSQQKSKIEVFRHISLPLGSSVNECLNDMLNNTEVLQCKCDLCGGECASSRWTFNILPRFLIVQLNRFRVKDSRAVKLRTPVDINTELQINCPSQSDTPGIENSIAEARETDRNELGGPASTYRLISVLSHVGTRANSGHYMSDCSSDSSNHWMNYNDRWVTMTTETDVLAVRSTDAYMLLYERE